MPKIIPPRATITRARIQVRSVRPLLEGDDVALSASPSLTSIPPKAWQQKHATDLRKKE